MVCFVLGIFLRIISNVFFAKKILVMKKKYIFKCYNYTKNLNQKKQSKKIA